MSVLVAYYSHGGNNKFIAEEIARTLRCDIKEIKPIIPSYFYLLFSTMVGLNIKILKLNSLDKYNKVILCGPLWVGKIAAPCNAFLKKCNNDFDKIEIITCCGSYDEEKNSKFGYEKAFSIIQEKYKGKVIGMHAIPIGLTLKTESRTNADIMGIKLQKDNFHNEIYERFMKILSSIKNS